MEEVAGKNASGLQQSVCRGDQRPEASLLCLHFHFLHEENKRKLSPGSLGQESDVPDSPEGSALGSSPSLDLGVLILRMAEDARWRSMFSAPSCLRSPLRRSGPALRSLAGWPSAGFSEAAGQLGPSGPGDQDQARTCCDDTAAAPAPGAQGPSGSTQPVHQSDSASSLRLSFPTLLRTGAIQAHVFPLWKFAKCQICTNVQEMLNPKLWVQECPGWPCCRPGVRKQRRPFLLPRHPHGGTSATREQQRAQIPQKTADDLGRPEPECLARAWDFQLHNCQETLHKHLGHLGLVESEPQGPRVLHSPSPHRS